MILHDDLRYTRGEFEYDDVQADAFDATCSNTSDCVSPRSPLDLPLLRKSWIDSDYTDERLSPKVVNGVKMGEGDGTVSLLSLGSMCVEGWKKKRWNPAGIEVVTVEVGVMFNIFRVFLFAYFCELAPTSPCPNHSPGRRHYCRSR